MIDAEGTFDKTAGKSHQTESRPKVEGRWLDRLVAGPARARLLAALEGWQVGRLTVHLPDGSMAVAGAAHAEPHATLWIERDAFFRKFALRGDLGAGESYMDGDWRTDDLSRFVELVLRNQAHLPLDSLVSRLANLPNDWLHRRRRNHRGGSRRNIGAHYDLSNDLFATFLDPSLAYSSGVYRSAGDTLEEAQRQKFERWCEALRLGPHDHVLEIGSGWGGFAIHAAATRGCRVRGITVSREQLALSRQRVEAAGLQDRVSLEFCDYRDVRGQYSRVVSIEMIEAVGEEYWPAFFSTIDAVLAPGGLAGIQAITMVDHKFDAYRRHCDWIQKYIFPGGLLPSVSEVAKVCASHTRLGLVGMEDRALDYARTLRAWRQAFIGRLDQVRALGFDERFIRMWEFYLATCEAAFRTRNLGLVHFVLARAGEDLR
jgi:cyclopropane-fatty-acyl-phospholipid synthase